MASTEQLAAGDVQYGAMKIMESIGAMGSAHGKLANALGNKKVKTDKPQPLTNLSWLLESFFKGFSKEVLVFVGNIQRTLLS